MSARNLIIIINPRLLDYRDFEEIGRLINKRNSQIRFSLLSLDDDIANFPTIDWRLPTFTVSLCPEVRSMPRRGSVFYNRQIDKLTQLEIMKNAGIPVPRSDSYVRGQTYDPTDWGEFVIVKSRSLIGSSKGKTAHVTPTRFLSSPDVFDEPVKSILLSDAAIIQEFVNTGTNPVEHRATTFLGRVLYLLQGKSTVNLPELDPNAPRTFIFDSKFKDPDNGITRQRRLVIDLEIIALAQRVAKAFPGIPLLGVDILKDVQTGKLYALEVNGGGNTWHFSSPSDSGDARRQISREERINQFGAWDIAASVLIEKTLYYAK